MNRHITAFLLAPLTVPLLMSALALQILREVPFLYWLGLLIAPVASCAGAILVGAPLACPLIGSMAGVIIGIALVVIFPLALESGILTSVVRIFADRAHWGEVS